MNFKNLIFITIPVLFLSQIVIAQNFSNEYGKITMDEHHMEVFKNDTSAEAVIIYDIGESYFYQIEDAYDTNLKTRRVDEVFTLYFERRTKIKVLKESYLNNAEYYIPIYKGFKGKEDIEKIEANTFNIENGKLIKSSLNIDKIITEEKNESWDIIKFTMPNVKVGSIIEFNYKISTPYYIMLRDWEFQSTIPTVYSEYKVSMNPFFEYQFNLQGATDFDEQNVYNSVGFKKDFNNIKYNDKVYQLIMKNVPAFTNESFLSSINDYLIKIDFQLSKYYYGGGYVEVLSSWGKLINNLTKSNKYGSILNKSKQGFKKTTEKVNLAEKNEREKVNYILNHIKQNYRWNGINSSLSNKSVNVFLKDKSGNSAIINLYLIGALQANGVEVYPVILSTRKNGKIETKYPLLDQFNYVLAYVKLKNKWTLLDATDTYCPNDMIPEKCINDIGLIIKKNEEKWIKLNHADMSAEEINISSKLTEDCDSLIGKFSIISTGYIALKLRKNFKDDHKKLEEHFISNNMIISDKVQSDNYKDINKNYKLTYNASQVTKNEANNIVIHPFFNMPLNDNPLKEKERKYPIDMVYPNSKIYKNEIQIPGNCAVKNLPENYSFNSDLFFLQYVVSENNGKINISASYQFKKSVYEPKDYAEIRTYFNLIIKHLNQKIVLIKK